MQESDDYSDSDSSSSEDNTEKMQARAPPSIALPAPDFGAIPAPDFDSDSGGTTNGGGIFYNPYEANRAENLHSKRKMVDGERETIFKKVEKKKR